MITRGRIGLLVAVVAVLAVAAVLLEDRGASTGDRDRGARLFPGLIDRVNDVARVTLHGAETTATLQRRGESWTLDELAGYPAKFGEVKSLVVALARLESLEAKTTNPQLWPRLGVQDPEGAGDAAADEETAPSTLVELADDAGASLARVVLGKTRPGQPPALYVRRAGEEQAWLARGELRLPATKTAWVEREIIHVAADRLGRVEIVHPDGERLVVSRPDAGTRSWRLDERPEGREPRYENAAMGPANALTRLNLEDVRRADDFPWPEDAVTAGRYEAFDGLVVTTRLADVEGHTWLALACEAPPPPPPPVAPPTDAQTSAETPGDAAPDAADPAGDTAPAADADSVPATDAAAAAEARKREKLLTEVASLNDRLRPWVFSVPEWKATAMRQHVEDLLAPVAPPDEAEAPTVPDDDV